MSDFQVTGEAHSFLMVVLYFEAARAHNVEALRRLPVFWATARKPASQRLAYKAAPPGANVQDSRRRRQVEPNQFEVPTDDLRMLSLVFISGMSAAFWQLG